MRLASTTSTTKAPGMARAGTSTFLLLLLTLSSSVHAQASGAGANIPPKTTDQVNLAYWNNANEEIATEFAPYNTCFVTESADTVSYAYLTMVPKNATVNFYKDPECGGAFAFAMDGYYLGYPGSARSYRWVGWSEDAVGELHTAGPIPLMPGSNTPPPTEPEQPPPKESEPSQPPPAKGGQEPVPKPDHGQTGGANDGEEHSYSSTFFGGVIGTLTVLSIGGVVFWRKIGRNMIDVDDKGKGVLPYNRVAGGGTDVSRSTANDDEIGEGDEDILLTTKDRMDHNSFALQDEDDDDDEDEGQGSGEGSSLEDERNLNNGLSSHSGSRQLDQ